MIAHLRSDPCRDCECAAILLSDVPTPKPCSHTDHARFRPTPIRCHSQKRERARSMVWCLRIVPTTLMYERHGSIFSSLLAYPLLPPRQSIYLLRLTRMFRGDPAIRRRRQSLVLHHIATPCLRPVAYRDVHPVICQTANSLQRQAALNWASPWPHTRGAFRACPFASSHFTGTVRSTSLTLSVVYIGT